MNLLLRNIFLLVLMLVASAAAMALRPTQLVADEGQKIDLETMVPLEFGKWTAAPHQPQIIINPVQEEVIKRVYDQTLTRTYIGPDNYSIMLSISYGRSQLSGQALAAHYPEVCYPAQGFEVKSNFVGTIKSARRILPVRRLETQQGSSRQEPVTYWFTLGDHVTVGGLNRRLIELQYGIAGRIPDGLLFRVSSIDGDSVNAFSIQEGFIQDLLSSLHPEALNHLAGAEKQ